MTSAVWSQNTLKKLGKQCGEITQYRDSDIDVWEWLKEKLEKIQLKLNDKYSVQYALQIGTSTSTLGRSLW